MIWLLLDLGILMLFLAILVLFAIIAVVLRFLNIYLNQITLINSVVMMVVSFVTANILLPEPFGQNRKEVVIAIAIGIAGLLITHFLQKTKIGFWFFAVIMSFVSAVVAGVIGIFIVEPMEVIEPTVGYFLGHLWFWLFFALGLVWTFGLHIRAGNKGEDLKRLLKKRKKDTIDFDSTEYFGEDCDIYAKSSANPQSQQQPDYKEESAHGGDEEPAKDTKPTTEEKAYEYRYFDGCDTIEKLKARYRGLTQAYHPDRNSGDTEVMKKINAEYDSVEANLNKN